MHTVHIIERIQYTVCDIHFVQTNHSSWIFSWV